MLGAHVMFKIRPMKFDGGERMILQSNLHQKHCGSDALNPIHPGKAGTAQSSWLCKNEKTCFY